MLFFLIKTSVLHFTSVNLTICMRLEQCKTVNVCSIDIGSERMKTKNHVVYKMIFKLKKIKLDVSLSIENQKRK